MSYPVPPLRLRLLLVRHGQTDGNSNGQFIGHQDIPLNETGERQIQATAQRLRKERPAAIYSSDLLRAYQTASAIQQAIQFSSSPAPVPELITDPRMREMHFGLWEGLTYSEIDKTYPEELKNWQADILHVAPPGGESLQQLAERAHDFLEELLVTYSGQSVIVVGHGGTFEALAIKILKLENGRSWQFQLNNTGICEFKFFPSGPILSLWNDTNHLEQV